MKNQDEYYNYPGFERFSEIQLSAAGSQSLKHIEPLIKADSLAYVIYERVDLDRQQQFMQDFGLQTVLKSDECLFMRGAGTSPYLYHVVRGEKDKFVGLGFTVTLEQDLEKALSAGDNLTIESVEVPGGGKRVRLRDPAGFVVDLVYGRKAVEPLALDRVEPFSVNTPFQTNRLGHLIRPKLEPASVIRLGHVVLVAPDFEEMVAWYKKYVGLLASDVMCVDDGTPVLVFGRLNRGANPADHHTVAIGTAPVPMLRHTAFEVLDIDCLGQGQQFLRSKGWHHQWGIGRHIQGSQFFDYWYDPAGAEVEHYADGDKLTESYEASYYPHDKGARWMWGPDFPDPPAPKASELPTDIPATLRQMFLRMLDKSRPWYSE